MKVGENSITIKGLVIPVNWDERGKAVAAALSTYTEDEYLIDNDYKGRELLHLIKEEVEITGVVKETKEKKIITVEKYVLKQA
jgi:hypothetical protein